MTPTSPSFPNGASGEIGHTSEAEARAAKADRVLRCCDCGAPGARVNEDAIFWMGRKAAEESARCDECNERGYMREQERLMEDGPPDWLRADKKYEGRR